MKVTTATRRIEADWLKTFVTLEGSSQEHILPTSKEKFQAQGFNETPETWPEGEAEPVALFTDLRDEESQNLILTGTTDPIIVALAIRASDQETEGPLAIPTAAEAERIIADLRKRLQ
jgi:hypothetical protein